LRLDFGGEEYRSIELGDGTGFVRVSDVYDIVAGQHVIGTQQLHYLLDEYDACAGNPENQWAIHRLLQAKNDLATLSLYTKMLCELFTETYILASTYWLKDPSDFKSQEYARRMFEIRAKMLELGIEVE